MTHFFLYLSIGAYFRMSTYVYVNCNNPFSFCKMKKSLLEGVETGNLFPGALHS